MNVTPLVDVVLVLLIIFMVVIPAMADGIDVDLPRVMNVGDEDEAAAEPLVLTITEAATTYLEDELVPTDALEDALRAASARDPSRRLMVRADSRLPYSEARSVFRVAQGAGFPGVSLRANRPEVAAAGGL
jgi:biopolymer transport protein ExbD